MADKYMQLVLTPAVQRAQGQILREEPSRGESTRDRRAHA